MVMKSRDLTETERAVFVRVKFQKSGYTWFVPDMPIYRKTPF